MFLWCPDYRLISHQVSDHKGGLGDNPSDRFAVSLLKKSMGNAYIYQS